MSKLPALPKAGAVGLAALITSTAYEEIKQFSFVHLTPWESHTLTIAYCAILIAFNESLMENLPGVVCVFDSSGKIRRWNTNLLGYSAAEIMKAGIVATPAPESLQTVQQTMKTAFERGAAESQAWLVSKGRAEIPYYLTGVRILLESEPCVVGIALDLGKRKQAQKQVRLQSAALEAAANAIVITDTVATIQWVNPAFTQLTGYTLEEAVGQNP
jgi:PAS domain S-box-containing protein